MSNFDEEYKKLNEQQKLAVNTIDGPLLVIAGPGTGKTQLLSMRVANILRKTDTDPQNILCLTFTNKASINMKERLLQIAGNDASKVMVKTFHSFAVEIMNFYPDYFWNGASLSTAPDAVLNEVITTILKTLPLDDPLALKFAGQYTSIKDVKTGLKLVKEAGLTPDKLMAIIELNLAYIEKIEPFIVDKLDPPLSIKKLAKLKQDFEKLEEQGIEKSFAPLNSLSDVIKSSLNFAISKDLELGKTTNTGKWKKDLVQKDNNGIKGMHKERERCKWWLSLANVYKIYRNLLHQRGYYDYADMLVEVISVIEQNPQLQSEIQDQFLYVLVDEFQDSNSAQMRLAHLVSDHQSNLGKPNLMVVGDDDQSIYKFNGAELANMLTFQKNYPSTKLVVLTENYRSSQDVLDISSKVIDKATDRLALRDPAINKNLKAKRPPKENSQILHKVYLNQAHQNYSIAKEIAKHWDNKQQIAILARNNDSLKQIANQLNNQQIPIAFAEQNNILEHQIIKITHLIASVILSINKGDFANTNYLLSQILRYPMWQIDPQTLWQLAIDGRHGNWLQLITQNADSKLSQVGNWFTYLSSNILVEPLAVIIEIILGLRTVSGFTSPVRQWYIKQTEIDKNYLQGLSSIELLLTVVNEFSHTQKANLEDFVNFMDLAISSNQTIPNELTILTGESAVELLTVHKAKGLEFDKVYIIDAIEGNWQPKTKTRRALLNLPLQPAFDDLDDYIRLMYVALTRAKKDITIASFRYNDKNQEVLPTPIIDNLLPEKVIKLNNNKTAISVYQSTIEWPELNIKDEKQILKPRINDFKLSVTALLDYLDVSRGGPRLFKENHILRLPFAQSVNMAFGTAIHSALEYAQILTNKNSFKVEPVINHFHQILKLQNLTISDFKRFSDYGQQLLERLFENESFWLSKNSLPEQSINDIILGSDIKLYGKIDRIDFSDDTITVVDYKTGQPLSSFMTKDKSKAIKAWRHKTQLTFYCLLTQLSPRFEKYKTHNGKMIYLEASQTKSMFREYSPKQEDIILLKKLIQIVWNNIQDYNFPNTSHYSQNIEGINQFINDLLNK